MWPNREGINENALVTQKIIVKRIQKINYWKDEDKYRIFSSAYKSSFVITTVGTMADTGNNLDNILKNDTIIIKIHSSRLSDLDNKLKAIPIYSLQKNGRQIYSVDRYNNAQKTHEKRWRTISIVSGVLFLLRGFPIVSSKTAYILAGLSFIIIITIRLLNIW